MFAPHFHDGWAGGSKGRHAFTRPPLPNTLTLLVDVTRLRSLCDELLKHCAGQKLERLWELRVLASSACVCVWHLGFNARLLLARMLDTAAVQKHLGRPSVHHRGHTHRLCEQPLCPWLLHVEMCAQVDASWGWWTAFDLPARR